MYADGVAVEPPPLHAVANETGHDSPRPSAPRRSGRVWIPALLTATAYLVASRYVILLNDPVNLGASFWPGAGITTAALLLCRRRAWPAILLAVGIAEFVNGVTLDYGVVPSLWWGAANMVEPLLAATIVRRLGADRFGSVRDTAVFVLAAVVAPVVGGAIGATGTVALGSGQPYLLIAAKWVVGDGLGILTVTPAAVMLIGRRLSVRGVLRPEGVTALAVVAVVSFFVFQSWAGPWDVVLPYLVLPPLVWIAARVGFAGTAVATFGVAQIANAATARGYGPFAEALDGAPEAVVLLQVFLGVVVMTTLVLASRTTEAENHASVALAEARRADREHAVTQFARTALAAPDVGTVLDAARGALPLVTEDAGAELRTTGGTSERGAAASGFTITGGRGTSAPFVVALPATAAPSTSRVAALGMFASLLESACRRIDAEAALVGSVKELRSTVATRDRLISVASHELRTPLTPIIGFAELLLTRSDELSQQSRTSVEAIERNADHLLGLIDDLLTLSRQRTGSLQCEPHALDVVEAARQLLHDRGYDDVALDNRTAVPPIAFFDIGHFSQIVTNLIINAQRYGRPPVTVEVDHASPDRIRVAVTDEGPGIDPAFVSHLFDEFTQENQSDVRASNGLGLGLAIARNLARTNAGDLTYRSREPHGARFELSLPTFRTAHG